MKTITPASGTVLNGVHNITIDSGSTLSLPNSFVVNGTTSIINNGTISGIGALNFTGPTFTNNGIVSIPSFQFGGTTQTLSGTGSFASNNTVTIASGATVTLGSDVQVGALNIVVGGTLDATNRKLSLSAAGAALAVSGTLITTGGAVVYNGTFPQTAAAITYNNVTFNNSAGVTAGGDTTVNGTATLPTVGLSAVTP